MGQLRTRKRGKTWEWSFEAAKVDGKRNMISKGGYRTKADAIAAGTQVKAEYDQGGQKFTPSNISVADFLDYWLENHVKRNMEYSTYSNYNQMVRAQIKPTFGHYKLTSIGPEMVQKWVNDLTDRGYARSSINNFFCCLSGAMQYAILPCKYIKYNPCTGVKIGRIKEKKEQKEYREYILSTEDYSRIINRFGENTNFYMPIQLGYNLGTRIGESYGINMLEDIDFQNHEIHIRNQLIKENGVWIYRHPKYDSVRTLKITADFERLLHKHLINRKKNILRYGEYFTRSYIDDSGKLIQLPATMDVPLKEIYPICTKENGDILTPESFKYCARVVHYELGIPNFHYHSLRHTHGTILAENGANPKTVMERLGHKNISTTMERYVFNTEKMQQDAISIFESAII